MFATKLTRPAGTYHLYYSQVTHLALILIAKPIEYHHISRAVHYELHPQFHVPVSLALKYLEFRRVSCHELPTMQLSLIVCTRNRAHAVVGCLDSIAASLAHAFPVDAEIVVVDNASDDDTSETVAEWAHTCSFPVQTLSEPIKGLAHARNAAIRAARGTLLAFTDDDCRLSREYIMELLRHDAGDTTLVLRGGSVVLGDPNDLPLSIKHTPAVVRRSLAQNSARHENIGDTIIGCNMAMRRGLVEKLGDFDTRFGAGSRIPGGEDTDYIFRAYLAGIAIEYVPDMTVYHFHGRRSMEEGYALMRNYAVGTGALYAKYLFIHLNICRPFYWDFRKALSEVRTGVNRFAPAVGFSHRDWVFFCLVGMTRYFRGPLKERQHKA
jgi:glycosyltransferase involved in cell wall biosynthesis